MFVRTGRAVVPVVEGPHLVGLLANTGGPGRSDRARGPGLDLLRAAPGPSDTGAPAGGGTRPRPARTWTDRESPCQNGRWFGSITGGR